MTYRLPLGIDIGVTRVRVVEARAESGTAVVQAVAVRERSADDGEDAAHLAALVDDAVAELRTKQRHCVCALGGPAAFLRAIAFPEMTDVERRSAAHYEAQRYADFPIEDAIVRVHRLEGRAHLWAVGVARANAVNERLSILRRAGLKPVAVDHESCALLRALNGFDAVLDIGHRRSSLHVATEGTPVTLHAYSGGADVTRAIERELSVDTRTAEKRKRIVGTAGAGERAKSMLAGDLAALIATARRDFRVDRVALVGNGARLAGLGADIARASGASVEIPVAEPLHSGSYPHDVARSGAPDWTLASGLALWKRP